MNDKNSSKNQIIYLNNKNYTKKIITHNIYDIKNYYFK